MIWLLPLYYPAGLSNKDSSMLNRAKTIASTSTCRIKHGAVITKGGRVLSVGVNANRNIATNTSFPKLENAIHAEIAALKACSDTVGATMYIARVNNQGVERMSKPCEMCYAAIVKAGIKKIVYTIAETEVIC